MYKERNLRIKSSECADLWREWFDVKYKIKDKEKAKELRDKWCKCCDDFAILVRMAAYDRGHQHSKRVDTRYKQLQLDFTTPSHSDYTSHDNNYRHTNHPTTWLRRDT